MAATRTDPQWPRLAFSTQAARAILRERHRKEGTERKTARRGVSTERKHARTQHLKGEREKEKERERKREYEEHLEDLASLRRARASERKKERKKVCTQRLSFFQNLSKTPPSKMMLFARSIRDVVVVVVVVVPLGFSLSKYISAVFASLFARVFVCFECETKS